MNTLRVLLPVAAVLLASTATEAATYAFTTVDVPTAIGSTTVRDINNGELVVGQFTDGTGEHGYLYSGSTFTTLDDPIAAIGKTRATGINDSGLVTGNYTDSNGIQHGYLYNGSTYTTLDDPNAINLSSGQGTFTIAINNNNNVAGRYVDSSGKNYGFIYNGNSFSKLENPNSSYDASKKTLGYFGTTARGINDNGVVVGGYSNLLHFASGEEINSLFGYVYNGNTFKTIAVPGSIYTEALAINNIGLIVGDFINTTGRHAFVYDGISYTTLDAPDAVIALQATGAGTTAWGIGNDGRIVGSYNNASGTHGFIATPTSVPLPAAVWFYISGLSLISFARRKTLN